jgi:glycosyltransferase involved in cell wall biosynthesis
VADRGRIPGPRRIAGALKRRARRLGLSRDVIGLLPHPRLALRLARFDAAEDRQGRVPADPDAVAMLDATFAARPRLGLLKRKAALLGRLGELTAEREVLAELERRGDPTAGARRRMVEGRLTETDPTWLPVVPGTPARLERASPRRILHVVKSSAPERASGFTIRTMHDLHAQQSVGLEPVVVSEIGWPRVVGVIEVAPRIQVEGIDHYRLDRGPGYVPNKIPNDLRAQHNAEAMAPIVERVRPAILHAHSGYRGGDQALVALALRERYGIPVVYEVRGLFEAVWSPDPELAERSETYARRMAQETRILHAVDGILPISEALADELASRGIPRDKMTTIPNGIDTDALGDPPRDEDLRRRLGLEGKVVVGYLGNLDHWREGIDVLIEALGRLRRRGRHDVAVLVVGDGIRREALERLARERGLTDRVVFTGRVPHAEVGGYYRQMDVFANPRVEERAARYITPLKPYEAMALGLPVLVSDLPALREIVDPPNRGAVAPPGDPDALADAIVALVDDPAQRERLGAAGREWVRRERSWAANGPRYLAAYERILGPLG